MSRRFKSGRDLCVYCSKRPASTADHIVARKFFLESARADLPQAPSCEPCNNEKSKLEHYLATVIPFGGRHADALETLVSLVPRRLGKNQNLQRQLAAHHTQGNLPFDGAMLERLFLLIARGLMWHHWKVYLNDETQSVRCLITGWEMFDEMFFRCHAREHVSGVLGNGAFVYEGKRGAENPTRTIWRFSVFGGLVLSAEADSKPVQTRIIVMSGPKGVMDR